MKSKCQSSQSNIPQNRRTPNSGSGLRVRSICLPSGTEVLNALPKGGPALGETIYGTMRPPRTGRDITNVADLGQDSQKALPRGCLGSFGLCRLYGDLFQRSHNHSMKHLMTSLNHTN